jgi:small subunit ribosomal protein S4
MDLRGPKGKISRRLGIAITPKIQKILDRRAYPPGQHGPTTRNPGPKSVYGKQLREKQRLRAQYNVSEVQLRRYYTKAAQSKRQTGEALIGQLETRLDALVYRSGLARSIFAARQYVSHRHVLVNGERVSVPSIAISPGDVVQIREKSRTMDAFLDPRLTQVVVPDYLSVNREEFSFSLNRVPESHQIPVIVDLPMVVEYYSR